jgi:DNA-binding LacI/PurR family transcriptional regulator
MQKVAEELGYRLHLAARSLRQTKSRHIGVAFAPVSAPDLKDH